MSWTVNPVRGLRGELRIPGDKSISHRVVMLGALAEGETTASNFLPSADCLATVRCMRALGVEISNPIPDAIRIRGCGLRGLQEPADVLDAGNSGTTMRLLLGVLAGQEFFSVLTGDSSLRRRPMGRVTIPLQEMGASIMGRQDARFAPLAVRGGRLRGLSYRLPVASAQLKSALLLAGLYARGATRIIEPMPARDHTERMLTAFGAHLRCEKGGILLEPGSVLQGQTVMVPGDISSAAFLIVGALITPESDLLLRDVGVNPTRTGLLDVLQRMGARVTLGEIRHAGGEPVADIRVRSSRLRGTEVGGALIPRLIDEIPVLAVAAAFADGETVIRDAAELRVKESDRLSTVRRELSALGADIREEPDGLVIRGGARPAGGRCRSHGDHRIAMAAAVAGLAASGPTVIEEPECIAVSFPGFGDALKAAALD